MNSTMKTAGSFDKVLASCKSIGDRYQPNATGLTPSALSQLQERSQQATQAVIATRSAYTMAINNRRESLASIPTLAVRIVRMLASTEDSKEHLADAIALRRKLKPRYVKKSVPSEKPIDGSVPARRSLKRHYIEAQIETFANLVQLVEGMASYAPNEPDLKVDALKARVVDLQNKSHAVNEAAVAFKSARDERKNIAFGPKGIVATTRAIKNYIRGAFGFRSPEFLQLVKTR